MHSVAKVLASVFGVALLAAAAGGQCFSFQPACPGLNGPVKAMCSWDPDGAGPLLPRLVAGGSFTENGQGSHDYIAAWNGSAWDGLGWGTSGTVNAVTTWDPDGDGPLPARLVIGGDFLYVGADSTGQLTANHIAMWDGEAWRPLSAGADGTVRALTTWDPDGAGPQAPLLVAAGDFQNIGGVRVDFVATWDGTAWHNLGYGLSGPAKALATWDPDGDGPLGEQLVVGGTFLQAGASSTGAITVNNVAAWDGDVWHAFGQGLSLPGGTSSLASLPIPQSETPLLVVGSSNYLTYYWDGIVWRWTMPQYGLEDLEGPTAMVTFDPDGAGPLPPEVYAAGTMVIGVPTIGPDKQTYIEWWTYPGLSRWNGQRWRGLDILDVSAFGVLDPLGPQPTLFTNSGEPPFTVEMTVFPAPAFTIQPAGGASHLGGTVMLHAEANVSGQFEWHYAATSSSWGDQLYDGVRADGSVVSGASTDTLTISNLSTGIALGTTGPYANASFRCIFRDQCLASAASDLAIFRISRCSADFNKDHSVGTDQDILDFFSCIAGSCCPTCNGPDFNGDGDVGTDEDIEAFFRVLGGGSC